MEERAEQLAISSRYKSDFLANMSHELRTPLNSLLVLAKLLADNLDGNLSGKQVKFARTIHAAGSDLLQLINDILDLSKVEAGRWTSPADLQITALVDYVDATFRPMAADKGLGFTVEVRAGAPDRLYRRAAARADRAQPAVQRGQVHRGGRGRAHHRPADEAEFARRAARARPRPGVRGVDTGVGIATQKLGTIFDAFSQADGTTSRRYGGTGLGLSISRDIARLLGGEIRGPASWARAARSRCTCRRRARRSRVDPAVMARPAVPRDAPAILAEAARSPAAGDGDGRAERGEDPDRRRRRPQRLRADRRVRGPGPRSSSRTTDGPG